MEDILKAFGMVLPYVKYLFDEDISIALADREKFLLNLEGDTIHLNAKVGDPVAAGGAGAIVLKSGEPMVKDVPASVYGVPFKSYAVPIKNERREVVGVVLLAKNYEKRQLVSEISDHVLESIHHIVETTTEFTKQLNLLKEQNNEVKHRVSDIHNQAKQTDAVVDMIQKIANKSKILGLNASIEAARAGDAGRGFTVVAKEIQNMGQSTLESVKKISELLGTIGKSVQSVYDNMIQLEERFINQTEDTEKIVAYIEQLNEKAKDLAEFSKRL